jgi:hypothetical protein
MKTSEQINEIATALSKAQGEMTPAVKDAANPFFKSKYSDLNSINSVIKAPFSKYGLTILQDVTTAEKSVSVTTTLMHTSGQWIEFSPMTLPVSKPDIQGFGSAITYARRYAICSSLCIASSEDSRLDDDGNYNCIPALNDTNKPSTPKNVPIDPKLVQTISGQQLIQMENMLKNMPDDYRNNFMAYVEKSFGRKSLSCIPADKFNTIKMNLDEKLKSLEGMSIAV